MKSSHATQTRRTARRLTRQGFTIIELMVVLLLIGVLMGIAALNLPGILNKGKEKATKATMNVIATALSQYRMEANAYPANNGLQVLVDQEILSKSGDLNDAWGMPIAFVSPSQVNGMDVAYELRSGGKDNTLGTTDDIIYYPEMDN